MFNNKLRSIISRQGTTLTRVLVILLQPVIVFVPLSEKEVVIVGVIEMVVFCDALFQV